MLFNYVTSKCKYQHVITKFHIYILNPKLNVKKKLIYEYTKTILILLIGGTPKQTES